MIIEFKKDNNERMKTMIDLDLKEKIEIEKKVKPLIKKMDFQKLPYVDIVSIVKDAKFNVEARDMDIETTGCLIINNSNEGNEKGSIWVNTRFRNPDGEVDVVFKKSRFITAHEYGHYVLHGDHITSAHRDTYHRTEPMELEADYFARSILMPLNYFRSCYKLLDEFERNDKEFVVRALSRFFRVTKNKVRLRIKDIEELEGISV